MRWPHHHYQLNDFHCWPLPLLSPPPHRRWSMRLGPVPSVWNYYFEAIDDSIAVAAAVAHDLIALYAWIDWLAKRRSLCWMERLDTDARTLVLCAQLDRC